MFMYGIYGKFSLRLVEQFRFVFFLKKHRVTLYIPIVFLFQRVLTIEGS